MIKFDISSAICRLKYPYRIIRGKIAGVFEPIVVVFVVNNSCNLKCRYCFGRYDARDSHVDFTTKEIFDIVDELSLLGTRMLILQGGEPLLREDIKEIVGYIKRKGIYIGFVTNGLLLHKNINLIRKVDSLCISLDGRQEGHDLNRGKGTFKSTLEAIKLAKKEGFHLRVQATITRHTMNDVEFLVRLAKEIGFFQEFSLLYQCGKVLDNFRQLMLTDQETKKVIRDIIFWKKRGYPIYTSFRVLDNALHWSLPYTKSNLYSNEIVAGANYIPCYYGKTNFTIDGNGYVYPCFAVMDEFRALNLREVGLKEAIQHVRDKNNCAHCIYFTNNEHNLLLHFSVSQFFNQCRLQLQELLGIY
jgi:MoaA/NifB/PqqE/SkfB family radical SAM enzyme